MEDPQQLSIDQCFVHRRAPSRRRKKPGRKPAPRARARVRHRERVPVRKEHPVHVTLRMRRDVPSLRNPRWLRAFRETLARGCERGDFRVAHYSVQRDHVHMIVEAADKKALASGMKSIGSRIALAVNRVFRRKGRVLEGRFHSVVLATPRQVRNALRYVLLNDRKHRRQQGELLSGSEAPDSASSGRFFEGWKERIKAIPKTEVARPRSWLLANGWQRGGGPISLSEIPGQPGPTARLTSARSATHERRPREPPPPSRPTARRARLARPTPQAGGASPSSATTDSAPPASGSKNIWIIKTATPTTMQQSAMLKVGQTYPPIRRKSRKSMTSP